MSHSISKPTEQRWVLDWWIAVAITFVVVAATMGGWGLWLYETERYGHADLASVAYHTLQLFILHAPHLDPPVNWQIHVGRLLSAAVAFGAIIRGLWVLLGSAVHWRLRHAKRHVIVCGMGPLGNEIAQEFLVAGERVVIIESDESKTHTAPAGAVLLLGDACDEANLRRARVRTADKLIAVCDDVQKNVAIATIAGEILSREATSGQKGQKHELTCWLFVPDSRLRQLLKLDGVFPEVKSRFRVNVRGLDFFALAARQVLRDWPLDYEQVGEGSPKRVHLVIVGFGPAGQRLALQAARIGHFANEQKLKITILERMADSRLDEFLRQYPRFNKVVEFTSIVLDPDFSRWNDQILSAFDEDEDELVSLALCWDSQIGTVTSEAEMFRHLEQDDAVNLELALGILKSRTADMPRTMLFQTRQCGFARLFSKNAVSSNGLSKIIGIMHLTYPCPLGQYEV